MENLKINRVYIAALVAFLAVINFLDPSYSRGEGDDAALSEIAADSRTQEYLIGPEDVLEISVWRSEDLSKEVVVRPDGIISLPLIGDVPAAGRTPGQLQDEIIEKLKEYQETVVVSVIVQDVLSYNFFILGEIARPGVYDMKKKTTLIQAIALAGGFNQFASKNKIVVIREKADGSNGKKKIKIRFDNVIEEAGSEMNLVLRPGDTIFVP